MGGLSEFFLLNDALYMVKLDWIQMALEDRFVRLTGLLELRLVLSGQVAVHGLVVSTHHYPSPLRRRSLLHSDSSSRHVVSGLLGSANHEVVVLL